MSEHEHQAEEFRRIQEEARAVRVDFLVTELQTGHTLLDTARATRNEETRERTRALAREAYEEVTHRLASDRALALGAEEHAEIVAEHERLAARLRDER
jgi:hypothetical protein